MKKLLKLLIMAAALVGAVIGLLYFIAPTNDEEKGDTPDLESAQAKEWKEQINKLCEKGNWNVKGYNAIETGIHTDRVTSQGYLLSLDEENALQKYLFTASCNSLNKQVNELFRQSSYPAASVKSAEDILIFLKGKVGNFGPNSNLTEASNIISEYHQLMGSLSFSSSASYSRPLRAFNAVSAEAVQNRIKSLKYYNSHFSKNPTIKSQVSGLASNRAKAEVAYYDNLERAIENRSKSRQDIDELLEDQIQFKKLALNSNPNAVKRLNNFVTNPNKWK